MKKLNCLFILSMLCMWSFFVTAQEKSAQKPIDWFYTSGQKFSTGGARPSSIKIGRKVIVVYQGTSGLNLYYRVGTINNDKTSIIWSPKGSMRYDKGIEPSVAVLPDNNILEVHEGHSSHALYYRIGKLNNDDTIDWNIAGKKGIKYDSSGKDLSLAVGQIGQEVKIIEVHAGANASSNSNIYCNIGDYNAAENAINWEGSCLLEKYEKYKNKGYVFDLSNPRIAISPNNKIIFSFQSESSYVSHPLYLRYRILNSLEQFINLKNSKKEADIYCLGKQASLAAIPDGRILEMHSAHHGNIMHYELFNKNEKWQPECIRHGKGEFPSLIIFQDGNTETYKVIEIHEGGSTSNLYYNIGVIKINDI